ncbi:PIG-L family deacetylase [Candidatus Woesearchaeota archaeon]|nr:PIG-L family deacetylase [Candidatus Woesearchaeota archaeon]
MVNMKNNTNNKLRKKQKKSKKKRTQKETILCFCAHNDDQVIGAGGTLAKYAKEGKEVYTYIFSYGEGSHPHLNPRVIIKKRVSESRAADKIIGEKGSFHLGLKEGKFMDGIEKRGIKERIKEIITEKAPIKIFTHSQDDPHVDHRIVNKLILDIANEIKYYGDIYSFDIWNPLPARGREKPMLFVDISKTFNKKIKAIKCHNSQTVTLWTMLPATYTRAVINGLNHHCKYAEIFYKIN